MEHNYPIPVQVKPARCLERGLLRPGALELVSALTLEVEQFAADLRSKTYLPPNAPRTLVREIFGRLNQMITDDSYTYWQKRLAFLRLGSFLQQVYNAMANEIYAHELRGQVGRGIASLVLDTFLESIETPIDRKRLRCILQNRTRIAKRWGHMLGGSVFLLVGLSDRAETLV